MAEHLSQNEPSLPTPEQQEGHVYPYDAVVVLGGGLSVPEADQNLPDNEKRYYPSDYRHEHEHDYGMLGAGIRFVAATEMYLRNQTKTFVFDTGITEKNKDQFGQNVPTEARVYKEKFERVLEGLRKRPDYAERFQSLEQPTIILEEQSFSTLTNIQELVKLIKDHNWHAVAVISSDYHIPRAQALYNQVTAQMPDLHCTVTFISAEQYVKSAIPGKYDQVIDTYTSPTAHNEHGKEVLTPAGKRLMSERRGVADIETGQYSNTEFQLVDKPETDH